MRSAGRACAGPHSHTLQRICARQTWAGYRRPQGGIDSVGDPFRRIATDHQVDWCRKMQPFNVQQTAVCAVGGCSANCCAGAFELQSVLRRRRHGRHLQFGEHPRLPIDRDGQDWRYMWHTNAARTLRTNAARTRHTNAACTRHTNAARTWRASQRSSGATDAD